LGRYFEEKYEDREHNKQPGQYTPSQEAEEIVAAQERGNRAIAKDWRGKIKAEHTISKSLL
jgi:hypothetical protein